MTLQVLGFLLLGEIARQKLVNVAKTLINAIKAMPATSFITMTVWQQHKGFCQHNLAVNQT